MHLLLPVSIFLVVLGVIKFLAVGLVILALILTYRLIRGTLGFLGGMMFGFHSHHHRCCAAHRHAPPRPVVEPRHEVRRPVVPPPPVQPPRSYQQPPRRPYRSGAPTWSLMMLGILFFCLVAFGFRLREVVAAEGSSAPSPVVKSYGTAQTPWKISKEGWGKTSEDARRDALTKAYGQFLEDLRSQTPPLEWRPPPDYLEKHLRQRLQWDEDTRTLDEPVGRMKHATLTVSLTDQDRQEIRQLDQQVRREDRLLFLAKILAGVLVFLAAVAGYIRLDEWSKGYYTGWLRFGAASLIGGAAGAAVWLYLQHH
jgi:hypothetical protein